MQIIGASYISLLTTVILYDFLCAKQTKHTCTVSICFRHATKDL